MSRKKIIYMLLFYLLNIAVIFVLFMMFEDRVNGEYPPESIVISLMGAVITALYVFIPDILKLRKLTKEKKKEKEKGG